MQCPNCKSEDIERPATPSAMEIHKCRTCGEEIAVLCHYLPAKEHQLKRAIYRGRHCLSAPKDAAKNFIKLKKILRDCRWFQLANLENQRIAGKTEWMLGEFLDFEVERILNLCQASSIEVVFEKVEGDE